MFHPICLHSHHSYCHCAWDNPAHNDGKKSYNMKAMGNPDEQATKARQTITHQSTVDDFFSIIVSWVISCTMAVRMMWVQANRMEHKWGLFLKNGRIVSIALLAACSFFNFWMVKFKIMFFFDIHALNFSTKVLYVSKKPLSSKMT